MAKHLWKDGKDAVNWLNEKHVVVMLDGKFAAMNEAIDPETGYQKITLGYTSQQQQPKTRCHN